MALTAEEILERMDQIIAEARDEDGTERDLTEDETNRYEALETQLAAVNASNTLRRRHAAYHSPVPSDLAAAVHAGNGARYDGAYDRAFTNYLRTGKPNGDLVNAQSVGSDPAGGFLVSPLFRSKLVEVRKAMGGFSAFVDSFSTERGGGIEYPSVDDTANSGQITAEGAAFSGGSDIVFGTVLLGAFKYTSAGASNLPLKVSYELVQDAEFDVDGLVARLMGKRIQRKQAVDWAFGAGTTLPFGLVHAGTTADVTVTGASGITYNALVDVETALDPEYEENARWVMRKAVWQTVRKIVDTAGRPIILEQALSGAGGKVERSLLGYPVIIDQAFPDYVINTKFAALGDFTESYVIRRVRDLTVVVNPYSSAANGQIEYTAWERADGNIQNRKGYSILARGGT